MTAPDALTIWRTRSLVRPILLPINAIVSPAWYLRSTELFRRSRLDILSES